VTDRDALSWRTLLAVMVGGMAGTGLRLVADLLIQQPLSTLVVNVIGSLVLGYLVARVWPTASGWLKAGIGPGLLGSFTTFSALAVILAKFGPTVEAALYLAATLVLGLGAAFAGLRLGARR
jgi:fluoride exporter